MFVFFDVVWYLYASILFQSQALIALQQVTKHTYGPRIESKKELFP